MASPSERIEKTGLRCGSLKLLKNNKDPEKIEWGKCSGLLFEHEFVHASSRGLGLRCWKKDCRKFHPLEVLLSQAVEQNLLSHEQREAILVVLQEQPTKEPLIQSEEAKMSKAMYVFTLHEDEKDFRIKGAVLARSAREAASILGGELVEVDGWPMGSSTNSDELNLYGRIRFDHELFRCHSDMELRRIKLDYNPGPYYEKGPGLLLWEKARESGKELVLRRNFVTLPTYTYFS